MIRKVQYWTKQRVLVLKKIRDFLLMQGNYEAWSENLLTELPTVAQ